MKDVVDFFVIVEANKTHKNENKEFNFEKRQEEFRKYHDKIIYIKVEDMPDYNDDWAFENYQRNCIMRGLINSDPEDLIIISDVDEIPNPNIIESLSTNKSEIAFYTYKEFRKNIGRLFIFPEILFKKQFGMNVLDKTPLALEQNLFYYFLNCKCKEEWNGSIITKAKKISTPQKLRDRRNRFPRIKRAGWHFSYLGGVEKIMIKLNSIVESTANAYTEDYIKNCLNKGLDIYGREGKAFEFEFVHLDGTFPQDIDILIKKYSHLYYDKTI